MSEIKNVGWTWMTVNNFKCNHLMTLHFKGLISLCNGEVKLWYTCLPQAQHCVQRITQIYVPPPLDNI